MIAYVTQHRLTPTDRMMDELSKHAETIEYYLPKTPEETTEDTGRHTVPYMAERKIRGLVYPHNLEYLLLIHDSDTYMADEHYQPTTQVTCKYAKDHDKKFIINVRRNNATGPLEKAFFKIINRKTKHTVNQADKIICLCDAGKKWITGYFPKCAGKVEIIPNSLNPDDYAKAEPKAFKEKYRIPEDKPMILNVARIHKDKGIDQTLEAFMKIKEHVDVVLVLVGGAQDIGFLTPRHLDCLGRGDVFMLGELQHQEIVDAMHACEIFMSTPRREPFGYSVLEAMACNKPVVAYAVGGLPDMITFGYNGFITEFGNTDHLADYATTLLEYEELRKKMGKSNRKVIEQKFNIEDNAKKILNLCG